MSELIRKHKDRAAQLLAKGKIPAALVEYQKVAQAMPSDLAVRQKVAELLARVGKKAEAIAEYERVVNRYAETGQFFKATALCKVILQLDPSHHKTQEALAELYSKRRETAPRPASPPPVPERAIPLEKDALFLPGPTTPQLPAAPLSIEVSAELDDGEVLEEIPIVIEPEPVHPAPRDLPVIPLFSDLSREDFIAVLEGAVEARAFSQGETIVKEGDPGYAMYAIVQGQVGVVRTPPGESPRTVAKMNEGDLFGEMALVSDSPRLATIVAETDCVVLEFARPALDQIIKKHPTVGDAIERFYRDRLLENLLRSSPLLRPLSEEKKRAVAEAFQSESFKPGELLLEEGKLGDAFYLLLRGRCEVFHKDSAGKEHPYPEMKEGDAFGEISVLMGLPVSASVRSKGPIVVLWMPAEKFRALLLSEPLIRPMLTRMATERLQRTADLLSRTEALAADLRV